MYENNTRKCCINPYTNLEIVESGKCYFCVASFVKEPIGNIFEQDFDDIWYGEKAIEFRKSVLNGSYSKCDLKMCPMDENQEKAFLEDDYLKPPYPKLVLLDYVRACNVRCMICRDNVLFETKEDTEYYNQFKDKIVNICSKADIVFLNGGGELFVSKHLREVCHEIVDKNFRIKFFVCSNGLLFDENHVRDFNIVNNLGDVQISIHAASKKTYEKIVRGGNWDVLQKNLKYISELKKRKKIKCLYFNFVVHSLNYKEMPKFVKMAKKFGAIPSFWRFRSWKDDLVCENRSNNSNYEKYTVWEKDHKDYKKFLKVLKKLKGMNTEIRFWDSLFQKLYDEEKTGLRKLINFFK